MAIIKSVRGFTPEIGKDCFLAENAVVIGDVKMGDGCSIWYSTVLRGDVNSIRIGNGVNIQDGSVLHTLYEKSTIEIGDHVSVGHNVTIHGAKIHNLALCIKHNLRGTAFGHKLIGIAFKLLLFKFQFNKFFLTYFLFLYRIKFFIFRHILLSGHKLMIINYTTIIKKINRIK